MKKQYKVILISVGFIVSLYIIGRITGIIQFYKIPAISMEPGLMRGTRFMVSNLKIPKRNDIISFKRVMTEKDGFGEPGKKSTFMSRLIGFGGESIEIKDGLAYINGKLVDDSTKLKFRYLTTGEDLKKIAEVLNIDLASVDRSGTTDAPQEGAVSFISLTYDDYARAKKVATLIKDTLKNDARNFLFNNDENKKWTENNYGPIRIPQGYYFVLGDNRNFSDDSRYRGPIPETDFAGTFIMAY